ncbi:hypothetical protein E4T47_05085 [Aureobasidium subglaciale]|nr:hypothetical protein E4T47_05085 [Aureobasidium subglaciale]
MVSTRKGVYESDPRAAMKTRNKRKQVDELTRSLQDTPAHIETATEQQDTPDEYDWVTDLMNTREVPDQNNTGSKTTINSSGSSSMLSISTTQEEHQLTNFAAPAVPKTFNVDSHHTDRGFAHVENGIIVIPTHVYVASEAASGLFLEWAEVSLDQERIYVRYKFALEAGIVTNLREFYALPEDHGAKVGPTSFNQQLFFSAGLLYQARSILIDEGFRAPA